MRGWLARIAWVLCCCATGYAAVEPRPYSVEKYDVSLRADFVNQRLEGEARILLHGVSDMGVSALEFDAAGLRVTKVLDGAVELSFEQHRNSLFIVLVRPLHEDEQRTLTIQYSAGAADGLKFFADQIVAADVEGWLPCNDSAAEHATMHLTISAPVEMTAVASGKLISTRAEGKWTTTEWQSDLAAEPGRFGFVVGKFGGRNQESDGVTLRIFGGPDTAPSLGSAFTFFAEHTGKHYPLPIYTEAFTHADMVRAFIGLTILPEASAKDLRLRAEALANSWFGIWITAKNAGDRWITESLPVYLSIAFGGQADMGQISRAYNQVRSEGRDAPLADAVDRELLRNKGVWFLHLVDQGVGDTKFWEGLKLFTMRAWGRSVTSEDLQMAFDGVEAGQDAGNRKGPARTDAKSVDRLFETWVYGVSEEKVKSKR